MLLLSPNTFDLSPTKRLPSPKVVVFFEISSFTLFKPIITYGIAEQLMSKAAATVNTFTPIPVSILKIPKVGLLPVSPKKRTELST